MKIIISITATILFLPTLFAADIPKVVQSALDTADRVIVYSLSPKKSSGGFHGYPIQTNIQIADLTTIKALKNFIDKAISEDSSQALCFEPHHALRVFNGNRFYDFVLCFTCNSYEFYSGGRLLLQSSLGGSPEFLDNLMKPAMRNTAEQDAAANP